MPRALLSFLVAFCFLARGYGADPEEGVPCTDEECRTSLETAKAAACDALNKAVDDGRKVLNKVREEGEKIRIEITGNSIVSEMDKVVAREMINTSNEGNKAFEKALKQGSDLPVFECIIECEYAAAKQYPQKVDKFKSDLKSLQIKSLQKVEATLQKVTGVETKLKETLELYVTKIRNSFSTIGVSMNRDLALKEFARILKDSENLGGEFSGILAEYEESAQAILRDCEKTLPQLTEQARQCMEGCFGQ